MLILTSKLPWRRQPTTPVSINWAHPLSNGLIVFCYLGPYLKNLCNTGYGDETTRSGITVTEINDTIALDRTSSGYVDLGSSSFLQSITNLTLISSFTTNTRGASFMTGTTLPTTISLQTGSYFSCYISDGTSQWARGTLPGAGLFQYAATYDGTGATNADRLKLYVNGLNISATYSGTIPSQTASSLGSLRFPYINNTGTGLTTYGTIYARTLSDNEILDIYNNPYQMLSPTYSRRYFIPLGGPQTITFTTGTETGIGYSLGTIQPRTIGLTTGSETGLGYALSIVQPRSIVFTTGEAAGVGYQLGLVQPRAIGLVDGQETGIGYALGTIQPRTIGLETGSETGIGYAMGVSTGAGRTIDLVTGSETGLGYSFGVIQPRMIGFATGSETGIGYALTITPPGPVLGVVTGTETGIGYGLGVIQRGRKYRYPRPTKAIHTRHYTSRL